MCYLGWEPISCCISSDEYISLGSATGATDFRMRKVVMFPKIRWCGGDGNPEKSGTWGLLVKVSKREVAGSLLWVLGHLFLAAILAPWVFAGPGLYLSCYSGDRSCLGLCGLP